MGVKLMDNKKRVESNTFSFIKDNILTITDITRTNKLSEILNQYAGKETSEVYVIQNVKNRDAVGVLVDMEHYQRLLRLQEIIEEATDTYMYQVALERKEDKTCIPLSEVVKDDDFDLNELMDSLDDIDLDED
jgi:hypothetical protein